MHRWDEKCTWSNHVWDLSINFRLLQKQVWEKQNSSMWPEQNCLMAGSSNQILWMSWWRIRFCESREFLTKWATMKLGVWLKLRGIVLSVPVLSKNVGQEKLKSHILLNFVFYVDGQLQLLYTWDNICLYLLNRPLIWSRGSLYIVEWIKMPAPAMNCNQIDWVIIFIQLQRKVSRSLSYF
jgi:hypothetical protein